MADEPSSGRWARLDGLLAQVLELDADEREAVLEAACSDDPRLRLEIDALLRAEAAVSPVLDRGAAELAVEADRDLGSDATPTPGLPERLGPYRILREIGCGGSSRVVLAERDDGQLDRTVAVKILAADPAHRSESERRFRAERQILAGFDHPSIARVFDGGVADTGPWLVMEYVQGQPLTTFCTERRLPLEARLEIVIEVCAAVQYAHRRLVVHRDLKPSNILVRDDGRPKLLDFGIAKLLDARGSDLRAAAPATRTGLLLLTPEYAAPEQVLGVEVTTATDVYALGMVLHELLVGERPYEIEGRSPTQIEEVVCRRDPAPPRGIPRDLAAIVLRCLEKEPDRRYESARELSEDLRRFLDGRPVRARPVSWPVRRLRQARRHPRRTAVALAVLVTLSTLAFLVWQARHTAAERARLAADLGQRVERIHRILERAWARPTHDTTAEKELVREEMAKIERDAARFGAPGEGPRLSALGRAHLALGELDRARALLERAIEIGHRDPETTTALGATLGRQYENALATARATRDEKERTRLVERARVDLRDPAVRLLQPARAEESTGERWLVEASLATYEQRWDLAEERAGRALEAAPWLWEARLLRGDVHLERGLDADLVGDAENAARSYERAGIEYDAARETVRSNPRVAAAECRRLRVVLALERERGADLRAPVDAGLDACQRAIRIDPGLWSPHFWSAQIHYLWGTDRQAHGEDPLPDYDRSIAAAERAVALAPGEHAAHNALGLPFMNRAYLALTRGADPTDDLERATASFARGLALNPASAVSWNNIGITRKWTADHRGEEGRATPDDYREAVAAFDEANAVDPRYVQAWSNGCSARIALAKLLDANGDGSGATDALERAVEACDRSLEIRPSYHWGHDNRGQAAAELARLRFGNGLDPRPDLDAAIASFREARALNGRWVNPRGHLGEAHLLEAAWALASGADPVPFLERSRAAFTEALDLNAELQEGLEGLARTHLIEAEHHLLAGRSPAPALAAARRLATTALDLVPGRQGALLVLAEAGLLEAEQAARTGDRTDEALGDTERALGRILAENPSHLAAWSARAELSLLRTETALRRADAVGESLEAGFDAVRRGTEIRPGTWRLVATHGELLLAKARAAADPDERRALAVEARTRIAEALAGNPLLVRELEAARRTAGDLIEPRTGDS